MKEDAVSRLDTTVQRALAGDKEALAVLFFELRPVLLRGLACDDRHVDDPPAIAIPPMPVL